MKKSMKPTTTVANAVNTLITGEGAPLTAEVLRFVDRRDLVRACQKELEINTNNRRVKLPHLIVLIMSMLAGRYIWEANAFWISWVPQLTDGQHRLIAAIVAYGDHADLEWLAERYWGGKLPSAISSIRHANYRIPDLSPRCCLIIVRNCDPACFLVQDQDHAKRTGADMLLHDEEIGNKLTEWGYTGEECQTVLRDCYLRTTPGKSYTGKTEPRYGSLSKGGNVSANRYPKYWEQFGAYIEKAVDLMEYYNPEAYTPDEDGEVHRGWDATKLGSIRAHATAAIALYLMQYKTNELKTLDDLPEITTLVDSLSRMKPIGKTIVADPFGVGAWIRHHQSRKAGIKSKYIFSGLVAQILDPKRADLTVAQWDALIGLGKGDYDPEQDAQFRFVGPDSTQSV